MLLAVSTVAFPKLSLEALPRAVRAVGAEGVALNVSPDSAMTPDASTVAVDAFLTRCSATHVKVSAIYSYSGRLLLSGGAAAQDDLDLARRCIDIAGRLGAPLCRIFAGTTRGTQDTIDRFADACRPAVDHAAAAGIMMGFPTHRDLAFDPLSCLRLVERLGRTRVGIIFGGPNMELDGISPLDALHDMWNLVEQVELKDWRRRGNTIHPVPIGTGEATVWPVVEALGRGNFRGWVTLHHLKQHHPELPDLDAGTSAAVRQAASAARGPEQP